MARHIQQSTLSCGLALALAVPALAGDVTMQLDTGAGFSIKNGTGAIERLRVDETTGNVSRNGALFVHTTGTNNTFVGAGAGNLATSGPGGNSAFGANTLSSNTTGDVNTAVGHDALRDNTTGYSNTAVGFSALRFNTTGFGNSALGMQALSSSTTAARNTAVGYFALASNTSGANNSAVGYLTLRYNSTGSNNAAFGKEALRSNTFGSSNTAVGSRALFTNTSGDRNSALGTDALRSNTTGYGNVAVGYKALDLNTTGNTNAAVGFLALRVNTSGPFNAALGAHSLRANTTGGSNTAVGYGSLRSNTTAGANTALGMLALAGNTTGLRNTALGRYAGQNQTTGNDNIYLVNTGVAGETGQIKIGTSGTHTRAFVAGIRGATTVNADAIPVLIDSAGQLGTVSSSREVKRDIRDMGDATARLLELRPVTFRYREQAQTLPSGGEAAPEYGLIAEEVAEIFPDLVVYDDAGRPFTVKYHELAPMLLNEMKRQQREHAEDLAALTAKIARLEERLRPTP